ncbi:hypothetical protein ACHAP8_003559 [Fusarium lateritium]
MHLYHLEGEVRSTENSFKPTPQEETEAENLALKLRTSQSPDAICTNILDCKSAAKLAKNANRNKALHQFAIDSLLNHAECHPYLQDSVDRIRRRCSF